MKKSLLMVIAIVSVLFASCGSNNTKELTIPSVPTNGDEEVQWTTEKAKLHWIVGSTSATETPDFKKENANGLMVEMDLKANQRLQFPQATAKQLANSYCVYLIGNGENLIDLEFDNHSKDEMVRFFSGQTNICHVEARADRLKDAADLFDKTETFVIWLEN